MSPRKPDPPTIEYVLLGLIQMQPAHGYDLLHIFRENMGIGKIWHIKPGRLYALLDKLEQHGWLTSTIQNGDGFIQRKVYEISAVGQVYLEKWMTAPVQFPHRMRQDFLARLFFAQTLGPGAVRQLIDAQELTCKQWLTDLDEEPEAKSETDRFDQMVSGFRIGQIQAMLHWLTEIRSQITRGD